MDAQGLLRGIGFTGAEISTYPDPTGSDVAQEHRRH